MMRRPLAAVAVLLAALLLTVAAHGKGATAFQREPNPLLAERPRGDPGPRYTITYEMPGPSGKTDELVQDVYPYATPSPVTYTAGGQPFFGDYETSEGWFVAAPVLKDYLVEAGLPRNAPASGGGPQVVGPALGGVVVVGTLLAACALAAVLLRRRPRIA